MKTLLVQIEWVKVGDSEAALSDQMGLPEGRHEEICREIAAQFRYKRDNAKVTQWAIDKYDGVELIYALVNVGRFIGMYQSAHGDSE